MKPILVIIAFNNGAGQSWLQHHPGAREEYDWRFVTNKEHLLGYHGIDYVDLGSSRIEAYALEHFKAFNREWGREPGEPALA